MTVTINIHGENAAEALRELGGLSKGLLSSTAFTPTLSKEASATIVKGDFVEATIDLATGETKVQKTTPDEYAVKRERGKPAAGRARRTKEEIAEDEAADAADGSRGQISTDPENRVGPEDDAETQAQDKADEKAEVENNREPEKPLTIDDVKNAVGVFVSKFGMPAAQQDGPAIFVDAIGKPPEGEPYWKMSILPTDQATLRKTIDAWEAAIAISKRPVVG